jgi:hypothetical protein
MKKIWKWSLTPETLIDMPEGAQILTVQDQNGQPALWALVDPDARREARTFKTYGTGHPVPDNPGKYIGTFQHMNGMLVFHVFEEGE